MEEDRAAIIKFYLQGKSRDVNSFTALSKGIGTLATLQTDQEVDVPSLQPTYGTERLCGVGFIAKLQVNISSYDKVITIFKWDRTYLPPCIYIIL